MRFSIAVAVLTLLATIGGNDPDSIARSEPRTAQAAPVHQIYLRCIVPV